MEKDYLEQIIAGLDDPVLSESSVLRTKNEKTHPVQIREGTYNELKEISFKHGVKLVDLTEKLINYALDKNNFKSLDK